MANCEFYTYVHRRADTGEVFYVGKGKRDRAYVKRHRNNLWHRIVDKCGLVVEIVRYFDVEADAFQHERELIAHYRQSSALLANFTDGGDGASGAKRSEETRRKMSEAGKGKHNWTPSAEIRLKMSLSHMGKKQSPEAIAKSAAFHRGRKRSDETRANIAKALEGKYLGPWPESRLVGLGWGGKKHSEESKRKMSEAHKGRPKGPQSPEHIAKRIAAMKETLAKKREAAKMAASDQ